MNMREQFPKWVTPPVHPVNDAPMLSKAELKALADDIKKYGLQEPIVIWVDNTAETTGNKGPYPRYLLDGRNRIAALRLLDIADPNKAPTGKLSINTVRFCYAFKLETVLGGSKSASKWVVDTDPYALHLSLNYHRRQLSPAERRTMLSTVQKRWAIKQAIIKYPQKSDREIAKSVGVSAPTVGTVRTELSGQNVKILQTDHLPIERARAALEENPKLSKRQLQKKANVSSGTAVKARKETKMRKGVPLDKSQSLDRKPVTEGRKQREQDQVVNELIELCLEWAKKTDIDVASLITRFESAGKLKFSAFAKLLSKHIRETEKVYG
jgi:ParB-like chromosome segregation protein Spo0J